MNNNYQDRVIGYKIGNQYHKCNYQGHNKRRGHGNSAYKTLFLLVKRLRDAERKYFRTHNKADDLHPVKDAQKKIDAFINASKARSKNRYNARNTSFEVKRE